MNVTAKYGVECYNVDIQLRELDARKKTFSHLSLSTVYCGYMLAVSLMP